ncbi:MAG: phosphate-starvation-inducible PsiE family protein [Chloroflexota bacterium]|nr:phosphate-starvation-inducible PsiE family protein [Chloroflexota bacterium]
MSDHQADTHIQSEAASTLAPHTTHKPIASFAGELLERWDSLIYAIVGVCFFLGAFCALGYTLWHFWVLIHALLVKTEGFDATNVAQAIIQLISDLLLVLIIMEVLGTVIHYLKSHATSLRPFLFIGIVSATRGILSIGARLSVGEGSTGGAFTNSMIELGVNAAVILALGLTLKLLGKLVGD